MLGARALVGLGAEYLGSCLEDRGEAEERSVVVYGSEMGVDPMMGLLDCCRVSWRETNLLQTMSCELDRVEDVLGFERNVQLQTCGVSPSSTTTLGGSDSPLRDNASSSSMLSTIRGPEVGREPPA